MLISLKMSAIGGTWMRMVLKIKVLNIRLGVFRMPLNNYRHATAAAAGS